MMCAMEDAGRPWGAPAPPRIPLFARAILGIIAAAATWGVLAGIWWLVR